MRIRPVHVSMGRRYRADNRGSDTDPKFYLPAGNTPPFYASHFERLWASLFDRYVESP
jgi:hypothetical protein